MSPESAPKRALSSLLVEDCHALYEAAFGSTPARVLKWHYELESNCLTIHDCCFYLTIYTNGSTTASRRAFGSAFNDLCAGFNLPLLMQAIDKLNIQFESKKASPSTPVQS